MDGTILFLAGALTLAGVYAALALILNLSAGWGGVWDLGIAGMLGIGAYAFTLVTLDPARHPEQPIALGLPMPVGILIAAVLSGVVALMIGVPSLRLRGEYFLITTFAFAEVARQLFVNQERLTGGTVGLNQLDRPLRDAVEGSDYRYLLLVVTALAVLVVYLFVRRMGRAPYGRLLRALRDNEPLALALGKNVTSYRIKTFVLAGVLIGAVAPLYVWYLQRVVPDLFASDLTFAVWTALVIGGIGSFRGPVLGAVLLILMIEAVQFLQVDAEHAVTLAAMRPLIIGVLLIAVLRFRPEGLLTERRSFTSKRSRRLTPLAARPSSRVGAGSGPAGEST